MADFQKTDYLKIVGSGLGRTGTASLQLALNKLGYRTHHMKEVMQPSGTSTPQLESWEQLEREKGNRDRSVTLSKIFENYDAQVDFPGAAVWEELFQQNPKAKVILSLHPRGEEGWYQSVRETIYSAHTGFGVVGFVAKTSIFTPTINRLVRWTSALIWDGCLNGSLAKGKDAAIAEYNRRIEDTKRIVPPEQLLIFKATDGWEPLCKFLDKPIPDEPYPRTNDKNEMKTRMRGFAILAYATLGAYGGIIGGLSYLIHKRFHYCPLKSSGLAFGAFTVVWWLFSNPGKI
mmetsp:Transcript_17933/g.24905  ORF Transcript_17933/g.24905 Transcript_17933/m.24905 type:complete len:289 (+) Transcript_17933:86-952(+)|eukprot:CAMPEP_0201488916 /NCGR_PEP_ID=MMETSP0151_2-20130828/20263_1 /ASSEMBLY_ACC=CAM_ASM_000257 /TAXON_ID=200890 /ORGANISM="Paramoeba atlantica, Strain 621/1 / CCAP 1560/9" /LENGTH=288 /DNA_ID=CAMNT_0047874333 /DNA_START=86 /DNA_END=952 /DNA_ORIENTATION=+